jgi:hypothetical protein
MPTPSRAALLGVLLLATPSTAAAEPFSALARDAHEVAGDLSSLAAPFLTSCDALVGGSRALCESNLGRARAELEGRALLASMPAAGLVELGPYEPTSGGFRVRLPGFRVALPQGVASTRPTRGGALPEQTLAEAFVPIAPEDAAAFAARNAPERLRLRMIFRFGRRWDDPSAPRPEARRGVLVEMRAAQVYNESSGEVLLDSTVHASVPPPPASLDARRLLFGRGRGREVLWRTPDGEQVLFHVRIEPGAPPAGGGASPAVSTTVVLGTRRADTHELVRFEALDPEASVDLIPHGDLGALLVITEERTRRGHVGRGQVLLLRWDAARTRVEVRARWRGANDEAPPAWVRDPRAPLPEPSPAAPGAGGAT